MDALCLGDWAAQTPLCRAASLQLWGFTHNCLSFSTTVECIPHLLQGLNLNAIWPSPVNVQSYGGYHG